MPAAAAARVTCGESLRLTADAAPSGQSPPRIARQAPWSATSAEEHAVSTLMHGPCSPSVNDKRPLATEVVSPVTAYTDDGRLDARSAQSGRSLPTNTPPSPPSSVERRAPDACNAAYAVSSNSRCCGSIAPDSAADTPNAALSNRSASRTKPPCDTHAACTSLRAPTDPALAYWSQLSPPSSDRRIHKSANLESLLPLTFQDLRSGRCSTLRTPTTQRFVKTFKL